MTNASRALLPSIGRLRLQAGGVARVPPARPRLPRPRQPHPRDGRRVPLHADDALARAAPPDEEVLVRRKQHLSTPAADQQRSPTRRGFARRQGRGMMRALTMNSGSGTCGCACSILARYCESRWYTTKPDCACGGF